MRRKNTLSLLALAASMTLGGLGCAGRAPLDVSARYLDVGRHDQRQITQLLGEPDVVVELQQHAPCDQRWAYSRTTGRRVGGQCARQMLFVDFDRSGLLCDYALGQVSQ